VALTQQKTEQLAAEHASPVVIGGLGGSGTRLVAKILIELGVFMGDDLSSDNDNLVFTFFFKRPVAYKTGGHRWIKRNLVLFERYMRGQPFRPSDWLRFAAAYWGQCFPATSFDPQFHREQARKIAAIGKSGRLRAAARWGWKEPNSHIFLEHLAAYFPGMRYIHVIRHGLDMAFSGNTQQLRNWGDLAGVQIPADSSKLPIAQLEYWVKANESAIDRGRVLLGSRFYLCNYDALCLDPISHVKALLSFLNVKADDTTLGKLVTLPSLSSSQGRRKTHDLTIFDTQSLNAARRLRDSI
jgi:sulfotransferase family protein